MAASDWHSANKLPFIIGPQQLWQQAATDRATTPKALNPNCARPHFKRTIKRIAETT